MFVAASSEVNHLVPRHVTWELLQPSARAGTGLWGGMDLNRDGLPDILIGASRQSAPLAGSGCVFVFASVGKGDFRTPTFVFEGAPAGAGFGATVSAMPDIDGDDLAEVFINAPGVSLGNRPFGTVFRIPIRPDTAMIANWALMTNAGFNFPGKAALPAGDVNGDGRPDLLVTLPTFDGRYAREGAVWLFLGRTNGLPTTPDWIATGGQSNAVFGFSASAAGDVNGDGYDDIVVGASRLRGNDQGAGRFSVFFGSSTGLQSKAAFQVDGSERAAHLGEAVSGKGDLNGDGFADVAIGEPGEVQKASGCVRVYYGSRAGLSQNRSQTLVGAPGAAFGKSLAIVGDVNGDGCADLAVGEPEFAGAQWRDGRAYLFLGSRSGVSSTPACVIDAGRRGGRYAITVATAGDVDGDGLSDFLIGSPYWNTGKRNGGRVDLIFGSRTSFATQIQLFASQPTNAPTSLAIPQAIPASQELRRLSWRQSPFWMALIIGLLGTALTALWAALRARKNTDAKLEQERTRIAQDLHDDLGAEISLIKARGGAADESNTQEMLLAVDRAIWSVDPTRDTLEDLVMFLGEFTEGALANTGIRSYQALPKALPKKKLTPALRKSVFLTVKEALNNTVKHSSASEFWLRVSCDGSELNIVVEDNGKGLPSGNRPAPPSSPSGQSSDSTRVCGGNGLRNMRQRIEEIGGELRITQGSNGGTRVSIRVKF